MKRDFGHPPVQAERAGLERPGDEATARLVLFTVEGGLYGVGVGAVEGVARMPSITRVPGAPDDVLGIAPLSGGFVTVRDPRELLGLAQREPRGFPRLLVVRGPDETVGIAVDSVEEVSPEVEIADPARPTASPAVGGPVRGTCRVGGRTVTVLDSVALTLWRGR